MQKRYLISILVLFLLAVLNAPAHAVPDRNSNVDLTLWPRFWQGEGTRPTYDPQNPLFNLWSLKYGLRSWRDDYYAGKSTKPFKKSGCLVTSLAMLFRYYGVSYIPDKNHNAALNPMCDDPLYSIWCNSPHLETDPGNLNKWLTDNNVYVHDNTNGDDNLYSPDAVREFWLNAQWGGKWAIRPNDNCRPVADRVRDTCARVNWSDPKAEQLLNEDLTQKRPDIMKINWTGDDGAFHKSHFVLIGGYDWTEGYESYRAYDPNQSYNRYAPDAPGLNTLYKSPKSHNKLRVDRFTGEWFRYDWYWRDSIQAWAFSPVELMMISPEGKATGYDPASGTKITEIPRAYYDQESEPTADSEDPPTEPVKILALNELTAGNYILKIFGTGDGPYTIKLRKINDDGITEIDTIIGTATSSLRETYRITYSPTGEASLSQTNQAPIANAGTAQTAEQSYEITLDGSASSDPDGDPLKYTWSFVAWPPNSAATLSNASAANPTFTPDLPGTYVLQLVVNDHFTDSAPSTVTITATPLQSRISVISNFSTPLSAGSGFISFDINNIGRIGVSSGIINMTLKDPDGNVISTGNQTFSLGIGQTTTVTVPASIPSLKFGNYTLIYTQSDETRTGSQTTATISNSATVFFSFDKASYKVRETANLALNLTNAGKFNLDNATVTVSVPDANYSDTRDVSLGTNPNSATLNYVIPIPAAITAGQHSVNVSIALSSGSTTVQTAKLTVPDSSLTLNYFGSLTASAGDVLHYTIENVGGVDTSYLSEMFSIKDSKGVTIYEGNVAGSILAGEIKILADIQIPTNAVTGSVSFNIRIKDTRTGNLATFSRPVQISGLTSDLQTRTDKIVYSKTEAITDITNIANGTVGIEDGSLKIVVSKMKASGTGQFETFLPKDGWWPFIRPDSVASASDGSTYVVDYDNFYDYGRKRIQRFDGNFHVITKWKIDYTLYGIYWDNYHASISDIAIGPDGAVYVVDSWNRFILKFDSNGAFITKWGGYGNGDGQFDMPMSIAVSPDGFVYVADQWLNRIQKFDGNGTFITKWGSYGTGDGQFRVAESVAVGPDGFVYVLDYANSRVQKFDSNGNFVTKWGSYGTGDGQFNYPRGEIVVDPNGFVYVTDSDNYRVQKFDGSGNFITKWGSYGRCDGKFYFPYGIAVGMNGLVYVSDTIDGSIKKFDSSGNFISKWSRSGTCPGEFNQPNGIAVAADGSFYVADTGNSRVQKFNKDKSFIVTWGNYGSGNGQFNTPFGIAVGPDNSIYVADIYNNRIQKFDGNGNFITKWGSYGSGNGQFMYPSGVAVTSDGSVYVADTYNNRVQKFDNNGNFIAKWGGYGGGNGQFSAPRGIAVSSSGFVYVADAGNHRIQKFDLNGNFVAQWGSWGLNDGQFSAGPFGIAIGADGSVFATEAGDQSYNQRIQQFDSNGNFIKKWTGYGSGDGEFNNLRGIAITSDGSIYVADTGNHRIQRMASAGSAIEKLFETTLAINQSANTAQEYTTAIGALNTTGKLYLNAELKNGLGQTIATAEYPFYVVEGDTVLLFNTDKKIYKPGETVTITGEVRNLATIEAVNLKSEVRSQKSDGTAETIYSETFNVPAGGSHPFTIATTAGAEGLVTLTGTITQNNATLAELVDRYEAAAPKASLSMIGPDVANRNPFDVNVEIQNTGKVEESMQYALTDSQGNTIDIQQITLPAGEIKLLQYSRQITANAIYTVRLAGDVSQTATKTVLYGEAAIITMGQGSGLYPEGTVSIPVTVTNTGSVDETVVVTCQVRSQESEVSSQNKTYFVPRGGSVTDTLYYELTAGAYQITASSQNPVASSQVAFKVMKENVVAMTATPDTQGINGLIPVTVNLANSGYNTLNGTIALAVMNNFGKAVWRGEAPVSSLTSQVSANYVINVNSAGILPGAYSATVDLYSTGGQRLATNQTQVRVLGPIFEITSVPAHPSFTAGKQAVLSFAVKNTGTGAGPANFSVKAMDLLDQSAASSLQPGEEKVLAFTFTLPEDTEEKDYPADYALTSTVSQGTKDAVLFRVAQVKAAVTAALDKEAYRNGETAVLTLTITKQSLTEDGAYLAIIRYGAHHDMKPFTLSAAPVTLTFNVPLASITGEKLFYGIHFESGVSIHRDSLFINEARPDLAASFTGQTTADGVLLPEVGKDNIALITTAVTNYGKAASTGTTVSFYDGESLLETKPVRALNPQETQDIPFTWNVLGKAGERAIRAIADPQDTVIEYSEMNNTGMINARVPDITIFTDTDKDAYKIRQKVYISSLVTNLTGTTAYSGLTINTSAKDPSGNTAFARSSAINVLAPMTSTTGAEIWNTAGLPVDGAYTVTQTLTTSTGFNVQSSKSIVLEKAPDFTLAADVGSRKIKQGERATYVATLAPFNGWDHEVTMSMDGLPAGTTATFSPDRLLVPGQSQAVVISTDGTTIGTNTIYLSAQGTDEGEIVSHTTPLTLEVSGFGIESATPGATLKQLEKTVFPISLVALNGYSGPVSLSIADLPHGIKASLDSSQSVVPGTVNLTVLTSKYAKPGTYTLTIIGGDGLVRHKLDLSLIMQPNPDLAVGIIAAPGPGPQNDATVKVFNADFQAVLEIGAFTTKYGAAVITADIDSDGYDEIIVAEGPDPKNTATLKVLRRNGSPIMEYTVPGSKYGLTLAAGDLDGDWVDELIVGLGPDPNNPAVLKVLKFNGTGFTEIASWNAYPDLTYGVNIAVGDIDGDGQPEIITAPGPGPHNLVEVKVWKYAPSGFTEHSSFTAFEGTYGANIAAGDVDGDGKSELITGAGPDPKKMSLIRVYKADGTKIKEITPYEAVLGYGVFVTSGDLDGDGVNEIITGLGPGPQNEPRVKVFKADGTETAHFTAYPEKMGYGVRVSAGNTGK